MAAALAAGVGSYVGSNWDVPGFVSGLFSTVRGNTAGQEFQKKLSAIDFKLQRQQLGREDLRDLTELTTSRMDNFLIAGTLLLTFDITWFTDNGVLSVKLPNWYTTMFLINNFSACGFLMLSVWLAMHTSVAAHTIGVRLLTSYARLSIPSKQELENIKVDILPSWKQFMESSQDMVKAAIEEVTGAVHGNPKDKPTRSEDSSTVNAQAPKARPPLYRLATDEQTAMPRQEAAEPSGAHGEPAAARAPDGENEGQHWEDHHFENFSREQRRWRYYDKYSRVCLSFGVNQMLEALAHYILAVIRHHTPMAGFASVFAVKLLGILLMWLDTHTTNVMCDAFALVFLYLFPTLMAAVLLWLEPEPELSGESRLGAQRGDNPWFEPLVVTTCYVLKACWLLYAWCAVMRNGHAKDRLRTVCYMDVLDPEQLQLAQTIEVQRQVDRVRRAWTRLDIACDNAMDRERAKGSVGASTRHSVEVCTAVASLQHRTEQLRVMITGKRAQDLELTSARTYLRQAEDALKHFGTWVQTPAILRELEALREGGYWYSDEQKHDIERAYRTFLKHCKQHGLGVVAPDPGCTPQPPTGTEPRGNSSGSYRALNLSETDRSMALRVDTTADGLPMQIWYDPDSKQILQEDPTAVDLSKAVSSPMTALQLTSFNTGLEKYRNWERDLPTPREETGAARPEGGAPLDNVEEGASAAGSSAGSPHSGGGGGGGSPSGGGERQRLHHELAEASAGNRRFPFPVNTSSIQSAVDATDAAGGRNPGHAESGWLPESAFPCDLLPGKVVKWFTFGTALWWLLAMLFYNFDCEFKSPKAPSKPMPLAIPGAAQFFKISSLHCHASSVWVSTRFSLYSADHRAMGRASEPMAFTEVAELGKAELAAMLCRTPAPGASADAADCDMLMHSRDGSWQLRHLAAPAALGGAATPRLGFRTGGGEDAAGAGVAEEVQMPLPWRIVAASWAPEAVQGHEPASLALLAGWDGESVVVSEMRRQGAGWVAHPRFEVDPRYGRCVPGAHYGGSERVCHESRTPAQAVLQWLRRRPSRQGTVAKYVSVRALHFVEGGEVLAILSDDGDLDLWRLATSELLGRWAVGPGHVDLCHDGENFLVAHNGAAGKGGHEHSFGSRDLEVLPGIRTLILTEQASASPVFLGVTRCGPEGCSETSPRTFEI